MHQHRLHLLCARKDWNLSSPIRHAGRCCYENEHLFVTPFPGYQALVAMEASVYIQVHGAVGTVGGQFTGRLFPMRSSGSETNAPKGVVCLRSSRRAVRAVV